MTVGQRIKEARISMGISQLELGKRLGVSQAMIAQYENGARNPKTETLQKIGDALGISWTYFTNMFKETESLDSAKKIHSQYIEESHWRKITEDIFLSVYGKKRELPIKFKNTEFVIEKLTVYGEKPGDEIEIGSDEIYTIACTLRSVFFTLVESLGRTVDEAIKEDTNWINGPHGLVSVWQLLSKSEREVFLQDIIDNISDLAKNLDNQKEEAKQK